MDLDTLKKWLDLISGVAALFAGIVTAFWAYTKYVLERGLLPPVQFDVECKNAGLQGDKTVLEILVHLKNQGSSTLCATDIRVDVLSLNESDSPDLFDDPAKPTFGRLRFSQSLRKELAQGEEKPKQRGIKIVPYDTFVQPGVDQIYTLVTALPLHTTYVLLWSSFQYAQHPTLVSRIVLYISRRLGLIQYSLSHISKPHTVERVFRVMEPHSPLVP